MMMKMMTTFFPKTIFSRQNYGVVSFLMTLYTSYIFAQRGDKKAFRAS